MKNGLQTPFPLLFHLLFPAIFLLCGCAPGRHLDAALLLADIAAGDRPSLLKKWTPEPRRMPLSFQVKGRTYKGDLYLPGEEIGAGLLLVPGAAPGGKDDPRLVAFANTLARARFAVLVPDLPSLRSLQVHSGNVKEVADAFRWLLTLPELKSKESGMAAFSYAAGPAVLAAMERDLSEQVDFILAIGGYYDLPAVLTFFTTGCFRLEDRWHYLEPNAYGKWVFVASNLHRIEDPGDRALFEAMADRRMENPDAPLEDLAAGLGPEGRNFYDFVTADDPRRIPELLERLPEGVQKEITALDLANKDLSRLRAQLLLIHGYEDSIIPYSESIALDQTLPPKQANLYLVHGLMHVDLEPGIADRWHLWRAMDRLLSHRE